MDKAAMEPGKAATAIDGIQSETTRKFLVVEALETGEALVEIGKDAVAVDKNQTERCAEYYSPADSGVNGMYELSDDLVSFVLPEVDEECLKQVAELEEYSRGLWDDLVNKCGGLAGIEFADPSDPECAVSC